MIEFLRGYEDNIADWLPEMLAASVGTLQLTALSFVLAVALGFVVALARISRYRLVRAAAVAYIEVIRGTPALVILFLVYFGLPHVVPALTFDSFQGAVIGLGLHGAAMLAEVFRSGIEALHRGQTEAALSLGLTPTQTMGYVVLPQAMRVVLPPVANYIIGLLKETAVCSIIAAPELMLRAKDLSSSSFMPMHLFVLAAVLYFVMSYPMALVARYLEARLARGH